MLIIVVTGVKINAVVVDMFTFHGTGLPEPHEKLDLNSPVIQILSQTMRASSDQVSQRPAIHTPGLRIYTGFSIHQIPLVYTAICGCHQASNLQSSNYELDALSSGLLQLFVKIIKHKELYLLQKDGAVANVLLV